MQSKFILVLLLLLLCGCATSKQSVVKEYIPNEPGALPVEVFEESKLDQMPLPSHGTAPVHPHQLKIEGINGWVTMEYIVTKEGYVLDAKVIKSNHPDFSAAALAAIRMWRFGPAMIDGEPVACRMQIVFEFLLREGIPNEQIAMPSETFEASEERKPKTMSVEEFNRQHGKPKETLLEASSETPPEDAPEPPQELPLQEIGAAIILDLVVSKEGYVVDAKVIESTNPDFEAAVLEAAQSWKFEPRMEDGVPVETRMRVPMIFQSTTSE